MKKWFLAKGWTERGLLLRALIITIKQVQVWLVNILLFIKKLNI